MTDGARGPRGERVAAGVERLGSLAARRFFWVTFALFVAVGLCWTLATPLFASPDEPQHVLRAVSVVRGEILEPQAKHQLGGYTSVRAPASYVSGFEVGCFAFQPDIPATCAKYSSSGRSVHAAAEYGEYPPAYYLVVGLPSLVSSTLRTVYVMRGIAVLLVGWLLAMGAVSIARLRQRRIAAIGYAFAITPMALFLGAVVNPSGVEIAAAISLWASGTVLAVQSGEQVDAKLVRRVGLAAAVLALCRQLGPLWVAVVAVVVVLVAGRQGVQNLVRDRAARIWGGVIAASVVAQVTWVAVAGGLNLANPGAASHDSTSLVVRHSIGLSFSFFSQMIGNFGWLDTPAPLGVIVAWAFVLGVLIVLGLAWASRRRAAVLGGILAVAVVVPIVLEATAAHSVGYVWQGRYGLPLAAGVPIVAGILIARSPNAPALRGRLAGILAATFGIGQVLAFAQSLRRNSVGYNGPIFFFLHPVWKPPVPALLILVAFAVLIGALTWWLFWLPAPAPSDPSATRDDSESAAGQGDAVTTTNSL